MQEHLIFGIHTRNRLSQSAGIQQLLSEYGCSIRTRIGLHGVHDGVCAVDGVILLEMYGERTVCEELFTKLSALPGVEVQKMVFSHD